jgi:hypothetical protein
MGALVREPENNAYGRFRVLMRSDGRFVVLDPNLWPPNGPVFDAEADARSWAQREADLAGGERAREGAGE